MTKDTEESKGTDRETMIEWLDRLHAYQKGLEVRTSATGVNHCWEAGYSDASYYILEGSAPNRDGWDHRRLGEADIEDILRDREAKADEIGRLRAALDGFMVGVMDGERLDSSPEAWVRFGVRQPAVDTARHLLEGGRR